MGDTEVRTINHTQGLVASPKPAGPDPVMMVFTKMLEAHYGSCPTPDKDENPITVGEQWIEGCCAKLRADFGEHPMLLINAGYGEQAPKALFASRASVKRDAARALRKKKRMALFTSDETQISFVGPADMLEDVASRAVEEITVVIRQQTGDFSVTAITPK
jgi:hypothetical protein